MKLLQINVTLNSGSTGRIAEKIGEVAISNGCDSYIAYGRNSNKSTSKNIKIGNTFDQFVHGIETRMFDRHGLSSKSSTKKFINQLKKINPEIIHLHNIHGYFFNYVLFFNYLKDYNVPVVWTLHDCWPFTGHCAYFDYVDCQKWENGCYACPQISSYPKSYIDRSQYNYQVKKEVFTQIREINIVVPSTWLQGLVRKSFLKSFKVTVIYNGVDLEKFKPINLKSLNLDINVYYTKVILGVANPWTQRKGLNYFLELYKTLPSDYLIILIGLTDSQIKNLPRGIIGLKKTESIESLNEYYNLADVFVNPTLEDNFPTTNIEALAAGTPVVTFNTGGSGESVCEKSGKVVEKGSILDLENAILDILSKPKSFYQSECRNRAILHFDAEKNYKKYVELYEDLVNEK